MKSRRMRWAGNVARIGKRIDVYSVLVGNLRERDHLKDSGVDGRIILRSIFRKRDVGTWTSLFWFMIGTGGGLL
jgi:hypothetical protein